MSHVDEGALHAYLDGALDEYPTAEAESVRAHLDACAECAARLEVERRIRSDAHAMLGLAAPVVEVPSLEELRAYVQRTAQQRRGISRIQRMGWAASVVLALGAGWVLRDGQLQSRALDIGGEVMPRSGVSSAAGAPSEAVAAANDMAPDALAEESNESFRTDGAGRASSEDFLDGVATSVATALQASDQRAAENESVGEMELLGARALPSSPAEESPVDADLGKVSPTVADVAVEAPAAEPLPLDRLERVAEGPVVTAEDAVAVPADAAAMAIASGDSTANAQDVAGAAAGEIVGLTGRVENQVAVAGADTSQPASEEARRRQAREATSSPPAVIASAALSEPAPARGNAEADAPRSLVLEVEATDDEAVVEPLLSVPEHEVVDVTNLGEGSTAWGARVRQRMEDGRRFEVFHLEPGIDPSILPPMEPGVGEASTETPFGWVLVRGAMDDAELGDLLLRLFPESP